MKLSTGRGKLYMSLQTLSAHWEDTKEDWADAVRQEFERDHMEPLHDQTVATVRAIDRLAQVLEQMEQECG